MTTFPLKSQVKETEKQMSAYVHEKEHIDLLVWAAHHLTDAHSAVPMYTENGYLSSVTDKTQIGQILWDTNRDSVAYRYKEAPESVEYQYEAPRLGYSPEEVLLALRSYEYQSCEHPGWHDSSAKKFCDSLLGAMIHALPGVQQAQTWSVTSETLPQSALEKTVIYY